MITKYLNQLTFATIGSSVITLGLVTGAQAATFSGSLEISGQGFYLTEDGSQIESEMIFVDGTGDFDTWDGTGTVATEDFSGVSENDPYESFFTFSDGEEDYGFTLTGVESEDASGDFIAYSFTGYIEDEGDITTLEGTFTAQHGDGSSWSLSLETIDDTASVPEPSTMIGLMGISALGMTALRKKG